MLPKKTYTDQQTHEKMLNITNYQEMQTKTTTRHITSHLSEWLLSETTNNIYLRCGGKTLVQCWWECNCIATVENSMEIPQKLKIELPYGLAIFLVFFQTKQTLIWKRHIFPIFSSIIYNSRYGKQSKSSWIDEWIKKTCYLRWIHNIYIGFPGDSV